MATTDFTGLTGALDALPVGDNVGSLGVTGMDEALDGIGMTGIDTGTMPFPETTGSPTTSSSSSSLLSSLGSILSGVGNAALGIGSGIGDVTLASKGLTPQASNTLATAEGLASSMSQFMPLLLIGALIIGGIVLLKKV
ncbi:MAG TPA: hypothetical protein VGY31_03450 [Terriglobia bacterium]|nr:hypothetical protein [Terriglobia bacterium]